MSDEEFEKEKQDLIEMLNNLHQIKDAGLRKWIKIEIRAQILTILKKY